MRGSFWAGLALRAVSGGRPFPRKQYLYPVLHGDLPGGPLLAWRSDKADRHSLSFGMSVDASEAPEKRGSVLRDVRAHCTARESFHGYKLAFDQRAEFFPVGNLIGGVFDQHQRREFVSAQHALLRKQRTRRSI
jgi:hypothetical protein